MILSVLNISKSYGAEDTLQNISFVLNASQHAGLVGANGVGKSTLLKIIIGEVEPTGGKVRIPEEIEVGYLPQAILDFGGHTIDDLIYEAQGDLREIEGRLRYLEKEMSQAEGDELEAILVEYSELSEKFERRGGYEISYKIERVLDGLRVSHIPRDRSVATLSGGEKARVGLAALLIRSPELLLLDEPTNHLDFVALDWLETYLRNYRGGLVVVSHDRRFLNKTVNLIMEIDEHSKEIKQYVGNYDAYRKSKAIERDKWRLDYERQQEEIKALRQAIRGKARIVGHNRAARDRDKMAHHFFGERVQKSISRNIKSAEERLKRIQADPIAKLPEPLRINPDFDPHLLEGKTPLTATRICKSFGDHHVLRNVTLTIQTTDRIVLVGPNGVGKSTLLKILAGVDPKDAGEVMVASAVKIGYLDQEQDTLSTNKTVFEAYKHGLIGHDEDLKADLLRYGLLTYHDIFKHVEELSIGQRRKLQIARLMATRANMLLLDEPTNHISLDVLEEVEKALLTFPGPIVAISHDRWFIQRFANKVWELCNGNLSQYASTQSEGLSQLSLLPRHHSVVSEI